MRRPRVEEAVPAFPRREVAREPAELPRPLRPRQKLLARGAGALSATELLALALDGARGESATRRAERLLRRHGLRGLARLHAREWSSEPGVGPAAAVRLAAALELARRAHDRRPRERPHIGRPHDAFRRVRSLGTARKEHLVGLYLDAQNGLLRQETLSIGTLNTTRTHPREILYPAIEHLAAGFILAHNHPSGCLEPSPEDVEFTHAVRRAGELMGIDLYDHLIVAGEGYTSLRERGVL
jgi:DNA repair protein RadC